MRQYDICRLRPAQRGRKSHDLVVTLQANLMSDLETRVVAPLALEGQLPAIGRLRPAILCNGVRYNLIADRLSVLSNKHIGVVVGSCSERECDIPQALDIVFVGV